MKTPENKIDFEPPNIEGRMFELRRLNNDQLKGYRQWLVGGATGQESSGGNLDYTLSGIVLDERKLKP